MLIENVTNANLEMDDYEVFDDGVDEFYLTFDVAYNMVEVRLRPVEPIVFSYTLPDGNVMTMRALAVDGGYVWEANAACFRPGVFRHDGLVSIATIEGTWSLKHIPEYTARVLTGWPDMPRGRVY